MRNITKRKSPEAFEEWKKYRKPLHWDDLPGSIVPPSRRKHSVVYYSKIELRAYLLEEQSSLCCYCETTIINDPLKVKIDHVQPKLGNTNQEMLFKYSNLGLSCNGGEREVKPREIHCDTHKGNQTIPITPYNRRSKEEIDYTFNGGVVGKSTQAQETISILNLDIYKLKNLRFATLAGYLFQDKNNTKLISTSDAETLYAKLTIKPPIAYYSSVIKCLERILSTTS